MKFRITHLFVVTTLGSIVFAGLHYAPRTGGAFLLGLVLSQDLPQGSTAEHELANLAGLLVGMVVYSIGITLALIPLMEERPRSRKSDRSCPHVRR